MLDIESSLVDLAIFYELFLSGQTRWEQDEPHPSLDWVWLRSPIRRWSGRGGPQRRQATPIFSSGPVVAVLNGIRRARFINGEITQKELGEVVGVSRQTIMAIEAGKYPPSLEIAFRIACFFNMSIEGLFDYKPDVEGWPDTTGHKIMDAELREDGKPKRRSNATKTTTGRMKASIERTTDESAEHSSVEDVVENEISMADLRKII